MEIRVESGRNGSLRHIFRNNNAASSIDHAKPYGYDLVRHGLTRVESILLLTSDCAIEKKKTNHLPDRAS